VKLYLLLGDRNQRVLLGATALLRRARFVGAQVRRVGDAVLVVVQVGAAVLVLKAVFVLGFIGSLVKRVGDAIMIVVEVRATILVLETILVLGLVGAFVKRVGNPVAIRVQGARRRGRFSASIV
jgi:hypothetical protein